MAGFLYGINGRDPLTFVAAPIFLLLAAVVATVVPARQVSRVDPSWRCARSKPTSLELTVASSRHPRAGQSWRRRGQAPLGASTPSTCSSHGCHFARIVSTSAGVFP